MPRLLFEKKGRAIWISHLDLMRLFQRAFKRAGLHLTHTQGFNPRPSVSIALPLSVGVSSCCELLDFDLDGETVPNDEICSRLNEKLTEGVKVLQVYDTGRKLRDLALLRCTVMLEYDNGVPENAVEQIQNLFSKEHLLMQKKSKNGVQDVDIIPMIREIAVSQPNGNTLLMDAVICCQNPSLNPAMLHGAVDIFLPELKPDFAKCERIEIYDIQNIVFR